jgi:DNA-binding NtrC family response regulator
MEKSEALKIISMISDGLNPYNEDPHNNILPEQNPITARALCNAIMSLLSQSEKEKLKSNYGSQRPTRYIDSISGPLNLYLKKKESKEIQDALYETNFNEYDAATLLGYEIDDFLSKIREYSFGHLGIVAKFFLTEKPKGISIDEYINSIEIQLILEALDKADHRKTDAAELLGISFRSFRHRIEKFELDNKQEPIDSNYLERIERDSLDQFLKSVEREIIIHALKMTDGNKTECAAMLGITFRSFRHRIGLLDIEK